MFIFIKSAILMHQICDIMPCYCDHEKHKECETGKIETVRDACFHGLARYSLDGNEEKSASVERRKRQDVYHREVDRDKSSEKDEIGQAKSCCLTYCVHNADRASHLRKICSADNGGGNEIIDADRGELCIKVGLFCSVIESGEK